MRITSLIDIVLLISVLRLKQFLSLKLGILLILQRNFNIFTNDDSFRHNIKNSLFISFFSEFRITKIKAQTKKLNTYRGTLTV